MKDSKNNYFMQMALKEAKRAEREEEVPVGAVLVHGDRIIAKAHNQVIKKKDPTAHAEILAIRRAAGKAGDFRLKGLSMYVTIRPCPMCEGAIQWARIRRVFYGAPRGEQTPGNRVSYKGGINRSRCRDIIKDFFRKKR